MTHHATIVAVLGSLTLFGCAKPAATPPDTTADRQAIDRLNDREIALFTGQQMDSIGTVMADDVTLMPPNEPAISGLAAVKAWANAMYQQFTVAGQYSSKETTVSGDWAFTHYVGILTTTAKAGGVAKEEHIKGIHVFHHQADGSWKIVQDAWNADEPPPPMPAAPPKKK